MKTLSAQSKEAKVTRNTYIHLIIAVALFFLMRYGLLTETNGLTHQGLIVLAVFIPCCYLWCAVDVVWPSLFASVLIIMLGGMSYETAYSLQFGHNVVPQVWGTVMIATAMNETGVMRRVARWIISRKIVHNRPWVFFTLYAMAIYLVGCVGGYLSITLMSMMLAYEISTSIGYTKQDKFYKTLLIITIIVAPITQSALPFGRPISILAYNLTVKYGAEGATLVQFFVLSFLYGLIITLITPQVLRLFYKPDVSKYVHFDDAAIRKEVADTKFSPHGIAASCLMLANITVQVLSTINLPVISAYLSGIGTATISLSMAVLGMIIRIQNKPVIPVEYVHKLPMKVLVIMPTCFLFSAAFTGADYGISSYVGALLRPLLSNMSVLAVMMVSCVIIFIITNFASNVVLVVIGGVAFFPILKEMGATNGELITYGIMMSTMANSAFATAAGSASTNLVVNSDTEMAPGDYYPLVGLMGIVCSIVCCALMIPLGLLLFS